MTHLDERLSSFQEVTLALRLGTLLCPVNDGLIADHVFIVEYLEELRECLDHASISVAVDLDGVDQPDLGFGVGCKGFEDGGQGLMASVQEQEGCMG
jgi:hypothetical protein